MTNSVFFTYLVHVFQFMLDLLLKGENSQIPEFEKTAGGKKCLLLNIKKLKSRFFYRIRYVKDKLLLFLERKSHLENVIIKNMVLRKCLFSILGLASVLNTSNNNGSGSVTLGSKDIFLNIN